MLSACCEQVEPKVGPLSEQARRDLAYGAIVVLCFALGTGAVVAMVALAQPVLAALLG